MDLHEFWASLVYIVSSKTVRAIQRETLYQINKLSQRFPCPTLILELSLVLLGDLVPPSLSFLSILRIEVRFLSILSKHEVLFQNENRARCVDICL